MLYKMMSYLFRNDSYGRWIAKPHQLMWSLFIMAIGVVTFTYNDWIVFGVSTFILGAGSGVVIVLGMLWDKMTEYWDTLDSFANTMIKSNNPDLWQALGFKHPPETITITETKQADNDSGYSMKFHRLPVSPAVMQMIADNRLMNNDMEFPTEESPLGQNIPNYRKVKKYFKDNGFISQTHRKNPRLGYTFNRKGVDSLHQYASESIRNELKNRR